MTYIHPDYHSKSILNMVLAGLVCISLLGVFWLVALYNNIVNLNHNIAAMKADLDSVGAANTTLNSQITAALNTVTQGNLAAVDGLVQDNHPTYLPVNQPSQRETWPIASQR